MPLSAAELHRAVGALAPCLRPISYIEEGSGGKRFVGSAVLLSSGDQRAIVTAAHALDGSESKIVGMLDAGRRPWPEAFRRVQPIDSALQDPDLAFSVATVSDGAPAWRGGLTLNQLYPDQTFLPRASMVAVGFPASRVKTRYDRNALSVEPLAIGCDLASESEYRAVNADMETDLVVTFSQSRRLDSNGQPSAMPDPRGMSGGALFISTYDTHGAGGASYTPRLVGILKRCYRAPHHLLVATRIECFLDAVWLLRSGVPRRFRSGEYLTGRWTLRTA
jgi:hypothetical protein